MQSAQRIALLIFLTTISQVLSAEDLWMEELFNAIQNPITSLGNMTLKLTFDEGAANGDATILNVVPVVPVIVGDWKLINRAIIPVAHVDGPIPGPSNPNPGPGGSADGLGDINYSLFFSPVKSASVDWGVGPSLNLPTANDDQLGSGKWSGGITGFTILSTDWGNMGILGRQLWSFEGDPDRKNVNQSLLQPFLNYNLNEDGWFLLTNMIITSNWKVSNTNRWTVPVGGGVGKLFKVGNQALNTRFEVYHNVVRSTGAPKNTFNFTVQFLFPK